MSELDRERDAAWDDLRARRQGSEHQARCEHATCPGCPSCPCHRRPKQPRVGLTPDEATKHARRLRADAIAAIRLLNALTSGTKTQPLCLLERAIIRANNDIDVALKSPSLNGAVSGAGAHITVEDEDGNPDSVPVTAIELAVLTAHTDDIGATLDRLTDALADIVHRAAAAFSAVEDLQAISPAEAQRLIEAASSVQTCVHCGRVVTGTRDDRLRSGRCTPCYEYRLDHDSQDRPRYLIERELERELARDSTHPEQSS